MTNFIFNENAEFTKIKINDLPSAKILKDTDNLISVQNKDNKNNNNKAKDKLKVEEQKKISDFMLSLKDKYGVTL